MTRILKIGGSILTDKSRELAARPEEIDRIAAEIASCPEDLVLVHGAGSFGHIPAKRFGLPHNFSREGLRITHLSVARLCEMVVEALGRAGVECLPVHPLYSHAPSGQDRELLSGADKRDDKKRDNAGSAWRCGHGRFKGGGHSLRRSTGGISGRRA